MNRSFRNLDLNLLKILVVLYQEKNTRRAAERLFMTQPSVSRALNKLREHFQQELFIRNQYGLTPTSEGDELCRDVASALQILEHSVTLDEFSPETVEGKLSIGLNHFMAERYASKVYRHISQLAPNLQLEIESWNSSSLAKLAQGELDFGVNYLGMEVPSEVSTKPLGKESFSLYMRKNHPYLDDVRLSALSYYPMASILIPNWNQQESRVERILKQEKISVDVVLRSENVHSIMKVLTDSDLIFPALSGLLEESDHSQIVSIPIESIIDVPDVDFTRCLFSHRKNSNSEFYQWFTSHYGCLPLAPRDIRVPQKGHVLTASLIMTITLATVALGILPAEISFVAGALAFAIFGVVPLRSLYASIDWSVVVLLAALLPVANAMFTTGAADMIAQFLLDSIAQDNSIAALVLLLVVTMFLSDLMNNVATAAVMCPIAISTATQLGVNPDAFLMAIAIGASCAFLTPIGHQNNTLILGPGGFRFGDYWRLGLLLEVIVVVVSIPMLLWVWPL